MLGQVVLLISEEPTLRRMLRVTLHARGARLLECRRVRESAELIERHRPDLILLDLRLEASRGIATLQWIREHTDNPLVVFSDRDDESTTVGIFDAGADEYVTVPFKNGEMLARLRALVRRSLQTQQQKPGDSFRVGALEVDFAAREVRVRGKSVHLTPTEYKLLGVLIASAGRVVTHQRLLREVWGPDFVEQVQYLRVYMKQLRRKLELAPTAPQYLVTEPAIGYRMRVPPATR